MSPYLCTSLSKGNHQPEQCCEKGPLSGQVLGDIVTAVDRLVVRMFVSRADQIEQDSVGSAGLTTWGES